MLSRFFSLLERAALLRSARRARTALAENKERRRELFQRPDSGGGRLCPFAKTIPTPIARQAWTAITTGRAPFSASTWESCAVRSGATFVRRCRVPRLVGRVRGPNPRFRVQDESLVALECTETAVDFEAGYSALERERRSLIQTAANESRRQTTTKRYAAGS